MNSHVILSVLVLSVMPMTLGCAVMKAANQPDKKNLSVFSTGVPRSHVIAEIGPPVTTQEMSDGRTEDVFKFRQGYTKRTRILRAVAHGAADLATGFVWELAGTPLEMIADGTEVKTVVQYDPMGNVEAVEILQGEKAFQPSPWSLQPRATASRAPGSRMPGESTDPIRNPLSNPDISPTGGSFPELGNPELE